jgi:AAA family ATP:ADP antiporter
MLFVPVSAEVKRRVKTYLDVMVDTVAGGFGGLLLLLLIEVFNLPLSKISLFIFFFSIAWLGCTLLMRSEYLNTFRKELSSFLPEEKPEKPAIDHRKMLVGLLNIINGSSPKVSQEQLLFALTREEIVNRKAFKRPLLRLLTHDCSTVRAAVLRNLSNWPPRRIKLRMDRFLDDLDPEVRSAALEYLVAHDPKTNELQIRKKLETHDPALSGNLFLKLLAVSRNNATLRTQWKLEPYFKSVVSKLALMPLSERQAWTKVLLKASVPLAAKPGTDFILTSLAHQDPEVVAAAIRAAGAARSQSLVLPLIGLLSESPYRPLVKQELRGYGDELVEALPRFFAEKLPAVEDARHLPSLLKTGSSQKTVSFLLALVEVYYPNDLILRKETYRALNTLQQKIPRLKISANRIDRLIFQEIAALHLMEKISNVQRHLVTGQSAEISAARAGFIKLLERRRAGNLSRLFRLLGLCYPAGDIIPIYRAFTQVEGEHYASALELLDNLLKPSLRKRIVPVLERILLTKKDTQPPLRLAKRAKLEKAQTNGFTQLLQGSDSRLKLAVIYLIEQLGETKFIPLLTDRLQDANPRVANMAKRSLARLRH